MPPKPTARTEKIVQAATQLFASQGYHATSTREIAHLAKVSEHTLFRHFVRKEDLFWSALRSSTAVLTAQTDLLNEIRAGDTPEVVLPKILELIADIVSCRPEALRLIAIAFLELQAKADELCGNLFSPLLSGISHYLAGSVAKGEVLEVDPSLLTASLMAMVLMYPQFSKLTAGNSQPPLDRRDTVIAYSKFWLDMLSPRRQPSSRPINQTAV